MSTTDANYDQIKTNIGILQGDALSALLFNCYLADLAPELEKEKYGPKLQKERIAILSYADACVLLSESMTELKEMLRRLEEYCETNMLIINTKKTKIMIFRYGPIPREAKFKILGEEIEIVNSFRYLGVIFTSQLKYYEHVDRIVIKAKSKIGMIFAKTPVKEVGLDLALQLFDCYVKPIFEYCAIVWTSDFRKSYDQKINESLLLFLKKYL